MQVPGQVAMLLSELRVGVPWKHKVLSNSKIHLSISRYLACYKVLLTTISVRKGWHGTVFVNAKVNAALVALGVVRLLVSPLQAS
jgi:hypothetical protein